MFLVCVILWRKHVGISLKAFIPLKNRHTSKSYKEASVKNHTIEVLKKTVIFHPKEKNFKIQYFHMIWWKKN